MFCNPYFNVLRSETRLSFSSSEWNPDTKPEKSRQASVRQLKTASNDCARFVNSYFRSQKHCSLLGCCCLLEHEELLHLLRLHVELAVLPEILEDLPRLPVTFSLNELHHFQHSSWACNQIHNMKSACSNNRIHSGIVRPVVECCGHAAIESWRATYPERFC